MGEARMTLISLTESEAERRFWGAYAFSRPVELRGIEPQYKVLRYRLDFAIPFRKIAIEIDGYEYHSDKETFTRDRQRQRALEMLGWRFIRFSGKEACDDPFQCVREAAQLAAVFQATMISLTPEWQAATITLPDWVENYVGLGSSAIRDLSRVMIFETTVNPRHQHDIGISMTDAIRELKHWYSRNTVARAWGSLKGMGYIESIFGDPTPTQHRTGPHLWIGPWPLPPRR